MWRPFQGSLESATCYKTIRPCPRTCPKSDSLTCFSAGYRRSLPSPENIMTSPRVPEGLYKNHLIISFPSNVQGAERQSRQTTRPSPKKRFPIFDFFFALNRNKPSTPNERVSGNQPQARYEKHEPKHVTRAIDKNKITILKYTM